MGHIIRPLEGDILPEDSLLLNVVVGKAKDIRGFRDRDIQDLVYLRWTTHDEISIKNIGKLFLFCLDVRDRDNLDSLGAARYDGALFLFTKCRPRASFESFTFFQCPIMVRVESLHIQQTIRVARTALERIGKVLYFDILLLPLASKIS